MLARIGFEIPQVPPSFIVGSRAAHQLNIPLEDTVVYANPNQAGSKISFKSRYGNYINGEFVAPVKGMYFDNPSPVNGRAFCEIPRSTAEDIEKALDAAHAAKDAWGRTSLAERANILNKIADRMEANLEMLAVAET